MLSNSVSFVNMTSNEECCICLENIQREGYGHEINERVAHVFHENCITQWFRQRRAFCPLCDAEVSNYQDLVREGVQSFVVTRQSFGQDSSSYGICGQIFNADGSKRGNEFQINTYTANEQRYPTVASLDSGRFVVSWDS